MSHLYLEYGTNASSDSHQINLCLTIDESKNLTPSQKILLQLHDRFCN